MAKKFNVTGLCFSEDHFMADVTQKVDDTYKMVEEGDYFIINRPRQYGKTTMLHTISNRLIESGKYVVFNISFEGIGDAIFNDEAKFSQGFVRLLAKYAYESAPELKPWLVKVATETDSLEALGNVILELVSKTNKKVVVLIDEVDKSSNNQLFISFLALLRNQYLDRKRQPTFHSIILAGVHDVKSLKLKMRAGEEQKYNSPWNIAAVYKVDLNLYPNDIKSMLADYIKERGVKMDMQQIADRLFYFTSGYPYLVSHLCKTIDEDILPNKVLKEWDENDVNKAFQLLLKEEHNANFDTLIKNLENNPDLYQIAFSIVINGDVIAYKSDDPFINLGSLYGLFARSENDNLIIHNRIYRERIANMMISKWRTTNIIQGNYNLDTPNFKSPYLLPNQGLNMVHVLENFQEFMRQEYSNKDRKFLERDGRLIFLSFLKPIINGSGYDFKEPQISEERRLDVVITYYQHQYVAELKIWRGPAAHDKGLLQLADYLDRMGLSVGYLLIFDHSKRKTWTKDWEDVNGKRIYWVRV
jgi:AAA-like domain